MIILFEKEVVMYSFIPDLFVALRGGDTLAIAHGEVAINQPNPVTKEKDFASTFTHSHSSLDKRTLKRSLSSLVLFFIFVDRSLLLRCCIALLGLHWLRFGLSRVFSGEEGGNERYTCYSRHMRSGKTAMNSRPSGADPVVVCTHTPR